MTRPPRLPRRLRRRKPSTHVIVSYPQQLTDEEAEWVLDVLQRSGVRAVVLSGGPTVTKVSETRP